MLQTEQPQYHPNPNHTSYLNLNNPTHNNPHPHPPAQVRKKIQHFSFRLADKIGKGYTSVVYKGWNQQTQEVVAIKVIELKSLNDQIKKNLLQIQLECMRKVQHPNLLRFVDSYETVNNCYIITEYCEGGDLEKLLRLRGRFSEQQFMGFFRQIYAGYQSFLQAGYLHRDLKPANIFIKGDQLKIADFGMVKRLSQNPRDNYNVGTPVYMPPESLISNIYTQKSDVWSIGVMCYQLTHGTFPWRGQDQRQLKFNIQNTKVTYDYSLISVELAALINQCLDKNPNTRISIGEMMGNAWVRGVVGESSIRVSYGISINGVSSHANGNTGGNRTNGVLVVRNGNVGARGVGTIRSYTAPKAISLNHIPSVTLLPLQLQAVPSLQLIQTKQNANTLNYDTKTQRPTMDRETPAPQIPKRKTSMIESNRPNENAASITADKLSRLPALPKKSPLDYLISILNYLRYLYKIYKIITEIRSKILPDATKNTLLSILLKQLIKCLTGQQKIIRNKENVYALTGWDEFVGSKKWSAYTNVVGQYSQKYRKIYSQQQKTLQKDNSYRRISIPLKECLHQLHSSIKQSQPTISASNNRQLYQLIQLADYLITVYNMEQAIFCYGWLIFVEKSNINEIVECRCVVDDSNWYDIWTRLQEKIMAMGQYR